MRTLPAHDTNTPSQVEKNPGENSKCKCHLLLDVEKLGAITRTSGAGAGTNADSVATTVHHEMLSTDAHRDDCCTPKRSRSSGSSSRARSASQSPESRHTRVAANARRLKEPQRRRPRRPHVPRFSSSPPPPHLADLFLFRQCDHCVECASLSLIV